MDDFLQPLIPNIPGLLKDTEQVLVASSDVERHSDYVWVTADITSLYTDTHDLALIALNWFLSTFSDYSTTDKDYLMSVTTFFVQHNIFMFNNEFYLQVTGASMGRHFCPLWLTFTLHGGNLCFFF